MKGAPRRQQGKTALDLIEEAVHLLRTAPVAALASYCLGSLPFLLGLLYFWADMGRSPFAREHVVEAALGIALLFVWMKFWQALFARQLRAHLARETIPPLTLQQVGHIVFAQAVLQPTGLFVLPLAAVPVLPFAWAYAFYQNLTALADADTRNVRELFRQCARHAKLWPGQNHLVLLCLGAFAGFVFLNCTITCALLPLLLKSLLGVESIFSRGGTAMLNTTFFAAMFGLTYLCVDPILKTVYVLRCLYGESVQSGADLRADLQHFAAPAARLAACLLLGVTLAGAFTARAAEPTPAPAATPGKVSPVELNRAIDEVIQQRKYTWRRPREDLPEPPASQPGIIARFFNSVGRMIRDALRTVLEWIGKILERLFGGLRPSAPSLGTGLDWYLLSQILLYVLVAVVMAAVVFLLLRLWRNRRRKSEVLQTKAMQPVPDLTDENVGADQLPEDGWTKLARELLARGEFRLALRAFYLASLAHLAGRNLINLARFKSNHDYERELGRRAHALPALAQVFGENVSAFDRVWYGTHEASGELVSQFAANVERLKAGG